MELVKKIKSEGHRALADEPWLPELVNFVSNTGNLHKNARYANELAEFHARMVNPNKRTVHLRTISLLSDMPEKFPRLRNMLFKYAYSEERKDSTVLKKSVVDFFKKNEKLAEEYEQILKRFHDSYKEHGAFKNMVPADVVRLLSCLDIKLAAASSSLKADVVTKKLSLEAAQQDREIRKLLQKSNPGVLAKLPGLLQPGQSQPLDNTKKQKKIQPRSITFDDKGNPTSAQEVVKDEVLFFMFSIYVALFSAKIELTHVLGSIFLGPGNGISC